MKSFARVAQWVAGAAEAFGDPATPICQLFFRWECDLGPGPAVCVRGHDLVGGMVGGDLVLLLGRDFPPIPMPVCTGDPEVHNDEIDNYGAEEMAAGVWALTPSLNIEGLIHAFVVLYDVPSPAPWESKIIVALA